MKNINSKFSRNDPFQKMVLKTENSYHFLLPNSPTFFISCCTWKKKTDQTKRQKQVTKTSIRTNIRSFEESLIRAILGGVAGNFSIQKKEKNKRNEFEIFLVCSRKPNRGNEIWEKGTHLWWSRLRKLAEVSRGRLRARRAFAALKFWEIRVLCSSVISSFMAAFSLDILSES